MVMQWPGERAKPPSVSRQSSREITPARKSAQLFHTSVPLPSASPFQSPRSIGPAGMKMAGRFMESAPINKPGGGLVAAAHEHRAVGGIGAKQFLGLHGEEVAIEHRRRLLERLGEAHRRHLDRKAAGLPDAALHLLGALAEMAMAGIDVAPGVDDGDDRLAAIVLASEAHLRRARAVAERAQVLDPVPAVAAQLAGVPGHGRS